MLTSLQRGVLLAIFPFLVLFLIIFMPHFKIHKQSLSDTQKYYWGKFSIFLIIICFFTLVYGCMILFDKKNSLTYN